MIVVPRPGGVKGKQPARILAEGAGQASLKQRRRRHALGLAAGALLSGLAVYAGLSPAEPGVPRPTPLAGLIERLSEPTGYFDTDNLISNETSYLQVGDLLERDGRGGGIYLGVGPEQNFSYLARLRPSWAFIVDIRRDNMLQHLYLNWLFAAASDPYQYLCRLLSRPCPDTPPGAAEGIDSVLAALDEVAPRSEQLAENQSRALVHIRDGLGARLGEEDARTVEAIAGAFFREQLGLRFRSHGRSPMPYHPTLRALLLARTPSGSRGSFLDSLEDYTAVRDLHLRGRVVPVVGDFAGPHALRAIARFARERGETVRAFYVSNVEFYLIRNGSFGAFVENVRELPLEPDSVFIRAYFDYGRSHPARVPGHRSTTVLQPIPRFLALYDAGAFHSHWDVSTLGHLK